jgi:hypothetical protein
MIYDDKINEFLKNKGFNINNFYESEPGQFVFNKYFYYNGDLAVYVEVYGFDETFTAMQTDKRITVMEEKMKSLLQKQEYLSMFCLMEKGLRIQYLNEWYFDIPEQQRLEVFNTVYSSSEYGFEIDEEILMNIKELFALQKNDLPEELTLYRGETSRSTHYTDALSWSLKKKTAEFFARRFKSEGTIYACKVKKEDIINYITDRDEDEILVSSDYIYDVNEII